VIAQGDAILVKDLPAEIRAVAGGDPGAVVTAAHTTTPAAYTLTGALDFVFEQLKTSDEPIMARLEREMLTRGLAGEGGDEAKAAKLLGLSKTAVQRKARE
jgi:DNA-binding NtrC family response regulator